MKSALKTTGMFLLSLSLLFTISCSSDDEQAEAAYDFIDQNAQGSIEGNDFNFGSGKISDSNAENELFIKLYDDSETFTDPCDALGLGEFVNVFFSIPKEVGLYELTASFSIDEEGQTVTLFNPATFLNIVASDGAVEILTITAEQITGRIDARLDNDFVNGNFTAIFCSE
ncbi:MAG: hypothetical protein RIM99_15160 [Cyclobacteriaceae bacterium]